MVRKLGLLLLLAAFAVLASAPRLSAQSPTTKLKVAAAANLTDAFTVIAEQFQAETGITVKLTFGATGTLATEIRNGAKFDLFAAADVATIDALIKDDFILPDSKTLYATGKLIIWWLADSDIRITKLDDLLDPKITYIAMANPDLAPYGKATKQTLKAAGLWEPCSPSWWWRKTLQTPSSLSSTARQTSDLFRSRLSSQGRISSSRSAASSTSPSIRH